MKRSAVLVCQGRAMDQCWLVETPVLAVLRGGSAGLAVLVTGLVTEVVMAVCVMAVRFPAASFAEEVAGVFCRMAGDGREGWPCVVEEFGGENFEGCGVVYVVPERKDDRFEMRFVCGGQGFGEDGGGAPGDVGEELGVCVLEADEVVTAVMRGTEDDAVAGTGEFGDGLLKAAAGTVGESESMRQTLP